MLLISLNTFGNSSISVQRKSWCVCVCVKVCKTTIEQIFCWRILAKEEIGKFSYAFDKSETKFDLKQLIAQVEEGTLSNQIS